MEVKDVDLNDYFSSDMDVICILDESDFEDLCADYFYYEKTPPHTPVRFTFKQEHLMDEDVYWKGTFELDETGEISGISTTGRLKP